VTPDVAPGVAPDVGPSSGNDETIVDQVPPAPPCTPVSVAGSEEVDIEDDESGEES